MEPKFIVAVVLIAVGILFDIIGLAIPYWRYSSESSHGKTFSYSYGLWTSCGPDRYSGDNTCQSYQGPVPSSIEATRAFVLLGLFLAVGALVCFLLRQFMLKDKPLLNKVAAGVAIAAGILMLIGAIIYATDKSYTTDDGKAPSLHAGFALVIIAALSSGGGGVAMFITPTDE